MALNVGVFLMLVFLQPTTCRTKKTMDHRSRTGVGFVTVGDPQVGLDVVGRGRNKGRWFWDVFWLEKIG